MGPQIPLIVIAKRIQHTEFKKLFFFLLRYTFLFLPSHILPLFKYRIKSEWKMHDQTYKKWIYTKIQKICFINIGLLKHGFREMASWRLKKTLEVFVFSFSAGCCTFEHRLRTGWKVPRVVRVNSNPFCIRCCKMWICRRGFIYGSCKLVLHHILLLAFRESWTMWFRCNGQEEVEKQHGLFAPLI
jgi:hypothetical protein